MKHKYFPNRLSLFKHLGVLVEGLDVNRSLRLPNLWFADKDTDYKCNGTTTFCEKFNEVFGTKLDPKKSYSSGKRTTLFFNEVEDVVKEAPVAEVVDVVEEIVDEKETPEEIPEAEELTPDWEWIESLENTPEDKLKLDKYGETFGVKLNRRRTLSNMIKDFKEAL